MTFICWAWRDSVFWSSTLYKGSYNFHSARSGVSVSYVPPPGSYGEWRGYRFKAYPDPFPPQYLPPALFLRGAGLPRGPIELAGDGSEVGPPEHLAWRADMQSARNQSELHKVSMRHRSVKDWSLFIPYWCILLTVAAPWLGLLFRRARRRNKSVVTP